MGTASHGPASNVRGREATASGAWWRQGAAVAAALAQAVEAGGRFTGPPDPEDPLSCGANTVWVF